MDAEFYLIGDAQTLRRSSSNTPIYYESYCSIFLISSHSGRLVSWRRLSAEADKTNASEDKLTKSLSGELVDELVEAIKKALSEENSERAIVGSSVPVLEEAPEDDKSADAQGVRLPRPYRRLRPAYPESAARAEAEATVDVLVDVDADGEVSQVQIARWGGFGLDETTIATVRQLHFFPALRNGSPIPMRVLLRYNFRKPSQ
jgi:TonB family protein